MLKTMTAIGLGLLCSWASALELNQASRTELQALKGIGPKTVELIVGARDARAFSDWADLQQRVKGIGSGKSAALSQQGLTIAGKPFAAPAAAAQAMASKTKP